MANVVVGTLDLTSTSAQNFTITSFGTPAGAVIFANYIPTATGKDADYGGGVGQSVTFTDFSATRSVSIAFEDGQSKTDTIQLFENNFCIAHPNPASTKAAGTVTTTTDGISITLSTTMSGTHNAYLIITLLPSTVTVDVGSLSTNIANGNTASYTGWGGSSAPQAGLFLSNDCTSAPDTSSVNMMWGLGICINDGTQYQRNIAIGERDNLAKGDPRLNIRDDLIARHTPVDTGDSGFELTAWASNGFTLTTRNSSAGEDVPFILFGDLADAGAINWRHPTSGTPPISSSQTHSTNGTSASGGTFQPDSIITIYQPHYATWGDGGSVDNDACLGWGMADDTTEETMAAKWDDGSNTSDCRSRQITAAMGAYDDNDWSTHTVYEATLSSFDSNGVTFAYDAADTTNQRGVSLTLKFLLDEAMTGAPTQGTVSATGQAPTVLVDETAVIPEGTVSVSAQAPSTEAFDNAYGQPTQGAVSLAGQSPTADATENKWSAPVQGAVSVAGQAPTRLTTDETNIVPQGTVSITAQVPSTFISDNEFSQPTQGAISVTTSAPRAVNETELAKIVFNARTGVPNYMIPGQAIPARYADIQIEGQTPTAETAVFTGELSRPPLGSVTISGQAPLSVIPSTETASIPQGAVTVAGQAPDAAYTENATSLPTQGAVSVSGQAPTTSYTGNQWTTTPEGAVSVGSQVPTTNYTESQWSLPTQAAVSVTGQSPTGVSTDNRFSIPALGAVSAAAQAPTTSYTGNVWSAPTQGAVSVSAQAPTTSYTENKWSLPTQGAVAVSAQAPDVVATSGEYSLPTQSSIALSAQAPSTDYTENKSSLPTEATISVSGQAPDSVATEDRLSLPTEAAVSLAGQAPVTDYTEDKQSIPAQGTVSLVGQAPTAVFTENAFSQPTEASVSLLGQAPDAILTENKWSLPTQGAVSFAGQAPYVNDGSGEAVIAPQGVVSLAGQAPSVFTPIVGDITEGAISVSAQAPTILTKIIGQIPEGAISATSQAPDTTATENKWSVVPQGAVSAAAQVPNAFTPVVGQITQAAISAAGQAPVTVYPENAYSQPPQANITMAAQAPLGITSEPQDVIVPRGTISLLGQAPRVVVGTGSILDTSSHKPLHSSLHGPVHRTI